MSRFRLLWVALLGLGLVRCTVPSLEDLWREKGFCAVGDEDCGMLRIRVDAQGFVPGCLKFEAQEAGGTATLTATVPYRGTARAGKTLTQGFSPPKDWGLGVAVTVSAFEQGCDGSAVTTQSRQSTVREGGVSEVAFALVASDADGDGYVFMGTGGTDCDDTNAAVNPGAPELCNGRDDNCDGRNDEGLGLGDACVSENTCAGIKICGSDGAVTCFAEVVQFAWADEDQDGHGDKSAGQVPVCTGGALPSNRLPLSAPHDDCDDHQSSIHPGAVEVCNGRDDNCSGISDEGFNVGALCFESGTQCDGTLQCNAAGDGTRCVPSGIVPTWYPDDDQDNYGAQDGGIALCSQPGAGFVRQGGDCDDGNPFTFPDAIELCDEQDNNCNAMIDEAGACPNGSPTWESQTVLDAGANFRAVSVYGNGGVWAVGADSVRVFKTPGSTVFAQVPGRCTTGTAPQDLYSVWAHPQTGMAFMGRDDGALIVQTPFSTDCTPRPALNPSSSTTMGLQGFVADGGVDIHGVVSDSAKGSGATFLWDGGTTVVTAKTLNAVQLRGIHGISPEIMFAVGEPASSAIYRYDPASATWRFNGSAPSNVTLNAVHVVNPRLAYAVGTAGTVLQWNGTWFSLPGLSSTRENLTGVLAFGTHSIYVTSDSGRVYRYNGTSWSPAYSGASINGIAGTRPDDIWVVGRFGQVAHYPGWPQ